MGPGARCAICYSRHDALKSRERQPERVVIRHERPEAGDSNDEADDTPKHLH